MMVSGLEKTGRGQENGALRPPLIAHVIFRLAVGGLENGLVNLINWMPPERYRHAIICLTDSTEFKLRIRRSDVPIIDLRKRPGHDLGVYVRAWKALQSLRPDIVHTRNLPTLEFLLLAALTLRTSRVHGEHGRDVYDLDGSSRKYNVFRRLARPFVHHYIAVSSDLATWLTRTVGVPTPKVSYIWNGVDTDRFRPRSGPRTGIIPEDFAKPGTFIVGTVGRMQEVKDQLTLPRAFVLLLQTEVQARERLRLVIVGDGPLKEQAIRLLRAAQAESLAWLPGERTDIPEIMQALDLFVLPSLAEGISNTILEAMACGLPAVATRVGGTPELVDEGKTGFLVPPADPASMAHAIRRYLNDETLLKAHGEAGRRHVLAQFSKEKMVNG
jgi:sugar transferase (PEP-CTERM/EpsH1 system associated)